MLTHFSYNFFKHITPSRYLWVHIIRASVITADRRIWRFYAQTNWMNNLKMPFQFQWKAYFISKYSMISSMDGGQKILSFQSITDFYFWLIYFPKRTQTLLEYHPTTIEEPIKKLIALMLPLLYKKVYSTDS